VIARPVDLVRVKGKTAGVRVYELLCLAADDDPDSRRLAALFEEALTDYLARDFRAALLRLEDAARLHPGDRPASLLAERCRRYLESPPPAGWDGIYVATEK